MFRENGIPVDRYEWTDEQETFPGIQPSLSFDDLHAASQSKGILDIQTSKSSVNFPGLERGYGNLLDKRQGTFGERLLAALSEGPKSEYKYIPRDPESEGREL